MTRDDLINRASDPTLSYSKRVAACDALLEEGSG